MRNMLLVTLIAVVGMFAVNCSNDLAPMPDKDTQVIVSYATYPVPSEYGDTIQVYQKNSDGTEDYLSTITINGDFFHDVDTLYVAKGSTLKAYYTYNRLDTYKDSVKRTPVEYYNGDELMYSHTYTENIKVPIYTTFYVKETITVNESYRWLISNKEPN